jgi:hypothetical protein
MNTALLIEALVRQTMVLIATLATATGSRSPLAGIADQVFGNLVAELKAQGLGNKVIADMFGMAMRTYHYRMARLAESATDRGSSVWGAVLGYIRDNGTVLRADILRRFERDDSELVRSVLRELVDARILYRTGRGDATAYKVATDESAEVIGDASALQHVLLVALHRHGPISREALARHVPLPEGAVDRLLTQLVAEGRVEEHTGDQGAPLYIHRSLLIDYGDAEGWQAALFDHYQAMVAAMCGKLRSGRARADATDHIGGSTYHFDLWPGHPLEREVLGFLSETRARARSLCERVIDINGKLAPDHIQSGRRVIAYVGQAVVQDDEDHHEES